ncbi:MAG: FAD-dependent oxidoreductase [Nitrospirae bacterium]|nr:FAD-dependent oxidoreductase [Nitrospirota bacterium]
MKKVIIIGGGFAGLTASAELLSAGFHVTLIEQRRFLGGRAYSFFDKKAGIELDNGQHILMGCYEKTFRFLKKIGVADKLYIQKNLCVDFADNRGGTYRLDCLPLPAPLHILSGILRFKALSLTDRLRILNIARGVLGGSLTNSSGNCSVAEWLAGLGQSEQSRDALWDIITLATMNEDPDRASAAIFKTVLRKAFFTGRKGSRIVLPAVPLSRLYVDAAETYLKQYGGDIQKGCLASEILIKNCKVSGIRLRDGRIVRGDYYMSAVPYHSLQRLLDAVIPAPASAWVNSAGIHGLDSLKSSPIISIHLLFDKPITRYPFVAAINSPIQWVFNKEMIYSDNAYKGLVSLVISGAHHYVDWTSDKLIAMSLSELRRMLPLADSAKLLYSKVIKERAATFSPLPGVEKYRPDQKTPIKNLFLAGDWTDTGLPATIEGAVISGLKCAKAIVSI